MSRTLRAAIWSCVLAAGIPCGLLADSLQICRDAIAGHQELGGDGVDTDSSCFAAASASHDTNLPGCSAHSEATADGILSYSAGAGSSSISFNGQFMPFNFATVEASGCFCDGGPSPGEEFASATTSADLLTSRPFSLSATTYYELEIFSLSSPASAFGAVDWEIVAEGGGVLASGSLSGSGSTTPYCFVAPPGNHVLNGEVAANESLSVSTALSCNKAAASAGSVAWSLSISAISCPSGDLSECCAPPAPPLPKPGPGPKPTELVPGG